MTTTINHRVTQIYSTLFTSRVFDITLLDKYMLENELDVTLVYALHSHLYHKEGRDTFIFSDVFDVEFQKIVDIFKALHLACVDLDLQGYTIDVMNVKNPICFTDTLIQSRFTQWLK